MTPGQVGPALVLTLLAGVVAASPRETITATSVESRDRLGEPANVILTSMMTGGYDVGRLSVQGTIRPLAAGSYASEARVRVTAPSGRSYTLSSRSIATFGTPTALSPTFSVSLPNAEPAAGVWSLEFFESFDDQAGADSTWDTFTLTLDDASPPPPPPGPSGAENLGVVAAGTSRTATINGFTGTPQVKWYSFTVPFPASAATGVYLDADTNDSYFELGDDRGTDTVAAIFDAIGNVVVADDDDGVGLASLASFGAVSSRGGGAMSQDGPLSAGVYYLAVAPSGTAFTSGFGVESPVLATPAYLRVKVASGFVSQPMEPPSINLGAITATGLSSPPEPLAAGSVVWFKFSIDSAAVSPGTFLDLDTEGSSLPIIMGGSGTADDTVVGLYDSLGNLLITDDDDGSGFLSQVSFGSGSGLPGLGDGLPGDGRDGTLIAGTYLVAVGGRGTLFGPTGWTVYTEAAESGTVRLNLSTNVGVPTCPADFNDDGFVDGFDYDDFVACFEGDPCPPGKTADFNNDGFPDGFDYDEFVAAFESGCL